MVCRVEGARVEGGHVAGMQVDDVHVGQLPLQLFQQLKHVEVGAEVFLQQVFYKLILGDGQNLTMISL